MDVPNPKIAAMLADEADAAEAGAAVDAPLVRNRTHLTPCPSCGGAHYETAADCPVDDDGFAWGCTEDCPDDCMADHRGEE